MKKNPVGRVLVQTDPAARRASAMRIPVRIFCLFLALIIWLAVVNLNRISEEKASRSDPSTEETTE